jgi:hypothetical protein
MMKVLITISALLMSTVMVTAQDNTYAACLMNATNFNATTGQSSNSFCTLANGDFARCNSTRVVNGSQTWTCTNTYKREEVFKRPTTFV